MLLLFSNQKLRETQARIQVVVSLARLVGARDKVEVKRTEIPAAVLVPTTLALENENSPRLFLR